MARRCRPSRSADLARPAGLRPRAESPARRWRSPCPRGGSTREDGRRRCPAKCTVPSSTARTAEPGGASMSIPRCPAEYRVSGAIKGRPIRAGAPVGQDQRVPPISVLGAAPTPPHPSPITQTAARSGDRAAAGAAVRSTSVSAAARPVSRDGLTAGSGGGMRRGCRIRRRRVKPNRAKRESRCATPAGEERWYHVGRSARERADYACPVPHGTAPIVSRQPSPSVPDPGFSVIGRGCARTPGFAPHGRDT